MDISALDFQQASIKQVLFKSQLRSVLYGVREADPTLFSPELNPLSQWLNTVIKPHYGAHPEVREMERLLQQMLGTGQSLVAQYQRGRIEEARSGMEQINTYSDRFTELLKQFERNSLQVG